MCLISVWYSKMRKEAKFLLNKQRRNKELIINILLALYDCTKRATNTALVDNLGKAGRIKR